MAESQADFWNAHADSFDSIYREDSRFRQWFNTTFRRSIYERFRLALQQSGDVTGKTVLDVGCGTGRYMVEYAKRGARRVVGLDFSPKMLALGRDLATREGVGERCEFMKGDFREVQLDDQFDVVLAIGVFDYIADSQRFLDKMVDTCRGTVIGSFPGTSRLRMYLRRPRYRLQGCPLFFYSESELRNMAERAGLRDFDLIFIPQSGGGFLLVGRPGDGREQPGRDSRGNRRP